MRPRHYPPIIVLLYLGYLGYNWYFHPEPEHRHRTSHSEYSESSRGSSSSREATSSTSSSSDAPAPGADSNNLEVYGDPQVVGSWSQPLILHNKGYIVGYDTQIQDPLWSETRFFAVANPESKARPTSFKPDERVPEQYRVTTDYWKGTGYDRGHMSPNEGISICYGTAAQTETFLLTNVIPQTPNLNRGLWETLEKIISFDKTSDGVRDDYGTRFGQVYVICGPVFNGQPARLRNGLIAIPTSCYKIILRTDGGHPQVLAFDMPQEIVQNHNKSNLLLYLTSVANIERETHLRFFPDMPEADRERIENTTATQLW